jgi:hypothetical protein
MGFGARCFQADVVDGLVILGFLAAVSKAVDHARYFFFSIFGKKDPPKRCSPV